MRTRSGVSFQNLEQKNKTKIKKKKMRKRIISTTNHIYYSYNQEEDICCKRRKRIDYLEELPDDIVLTILSKLSSTVNTPSDLFNSVVTCKRLNNLALNPLVLSKASPKLLTVKAKNWSESSHRFLKQCSDSGNIEATYTLGMIRFYCLENRGSGASLMAKAAMNSYAPALYSLAVIQFNGSGGSKTDKDLRAGVALCARAAFLGHIDALRELGHCLQDGYGVPQNVTEGRRFLIHANAREVAAVLYSHPPSSSVLFQARQLKLSNGMSCPLLSDFGCNVPPPEVHIANRFLTEWFEIKGTRNVDDVVEAGPDDDALGVRLCSHAGCGRPETRKHEFRRCSVCGAVNYCSRACQALDWKLRHKADCEPLEEFVVVDADGNGVDGDFSGVEDDDEEDVMIVES
ncbi:hypothetical protein MKW94_004471 [Papaver nudicaule]|uniref:MYND-type domain-containing protein n=1 Tax=Papaver nudicaule TaxID=74823 RepID=A0AA41VAD3_PAPNU|nr:hypothetical protein [Papaver nudicaule]